MRTMRSRFRLSTTALSMIGIVAFVVILTTASSCGLTIQGDGGDTAGDAQPESRISADGQIIVGDTASPQQDGASPDGGPGPGPVDAGPLPPPCASVCTGPGRVCMGETCTVQCPQAAGCDTGTPCPPGVACNIKCSANNACDTVSCGDVPTCTISCNAASACNNDTSCGNATTCMVTCNGAQACNGDVTCPTAATSCTISCGTGGCNGANRCCSNGTCYVKDKASCP